MVEENWKPIEGFSRYLISNLGRIKTIITNNILKAHPNAKGYLIVKARNDSGLLKNLKLHRCVAMAFIGDPTDDRNKVNHKDGIKTNNRYDNLEWVNTAENNKHAWDNNLIGSRVPITVTDLYTGEKLRFKMASHCATYFNILQKRLNRLCRNHEIEPWKDRYLFKIEDVKRRRGTLIRCIDLRTQELIIANSYADMEQRIKLPFKAMIKTLRKDGLCNGYYFWIGDNTTDALARIAKFTKSEIEESISRYSCNGAPVAREYTVYNYKTRERKVIRGFKEVAKHIGINQWKIQNFLRIKAIHPIHGYFVTEGDITEYPTFSEDLIEASLNGLIIKNKPGVKFTDLTTGITTCWPTLSKGSVALNTTLIKIKERINKPELYLDYKTELIPYSV